jgi:hypothetical protein
MVLTDRHHGITQYQTKRNEHPERWSKEERNWQPIGAVELNPEQHKEAA